jgi:hypothetical protein
MYRLRLPKHHLDTEHLCALEVLSDAGPWGCTTATLLAFGFPINMLANLVRDGLATARRETLAIGHRNVKAARVWITDAGQRALEDSALRPPRTGCCVDRA